MITHKHNINALIVDDEPQIVDILKQITNKFILTVYTAANGEEAKKILAEKKVHFLMTDLHMTQCDGVALIEWINEQKLDVTTVVITAHGSTSIVKRLLGKSIYDFIEKPFEPEILENTITRAIEKINHERITKEILELLLYQHSDITPEQFSKMKS